MNLRSLRVDLRNKKTALRDAERVLKFLQKGHVENPHSKEVWNIIEELKGQINNIEKAIAEREKRAKKKE